jgi:hypothetical protein
VLRFHHRAINATPLGDMNRAKESKSIWYVQDRAKRMRELPHAEGGIPWRPLPIHRSSDPGRARKRLSGLTCVYLRLSSEKKTIP